MLRIWNYVSWIKIQYRQRCFLAYGQGVTYDDSFPTALFVACWSLASRQWSRFSSKLPPQIGFLGNHFVSSLENNVSLLLTHLEWVGSLNMKLKVWALNTLTRGAQRMSRALVGLVHHHHCQERWAEPGDQLTTATNQMVWVKIRFLNRYNFSCLVRLLSAIKFLVTVSHRGWTVAVWLIGDDIWGCIAVHSSRVAQCSCNAVIVSCNCWNTDAKLVRSC